MADKIEFTVSVKDDGLPGLKTLTDGLDSAGAEAQELGRQAGEAVTQLRAVAQQQQAVEALKNLGLQSRELGNQLNAATANVERFGAARAAATTAAQAMAEAERKVAAEVDAAQTELQAMRQTLTELRSGSEQAARGTDEYRASVAQAKTTIAELAAQLNAKQVALAQAKAATKEAATEEKSLGREYSAAVAAAGSASAAVGENRRAMESAREAARALGIDTGNLSSENKRLDAAAQEARAGLDAVAASVERVRQRQAEAAGILQAFQGDLKTLGLDGPQAPAGLEQAFRKLGIDGVKKAEVAVHELQVALAQVRNSPDVLPADKKAAVAAFNKEVERLKGEALEAANSTNKLAEAGKEAGTSLGDAAYKAVAWAGALVGLDQLKSLAGQVLETGSAFENLEVRLSNLLGGTEAAAGAMGMIKDLASTTPFEVTALAESFIKLTAFGMQPTEAQMRSLADVTANLGGGTEALSGVTLALGQAWVKGKLQGEEIMQLAERGVPVWDALAQATGRTVPELQKMSEAGELGRETISKLIDELGRMNTGASEKLMNTYAGAVSNAKDAMAEFFDMIAKAGVLDFLTEKIRELLTEFERMKDTGELQQKAQEIADGFVAVARTAEAVTSTLVDMAPVIEAAVKVWLAFKAVNIATTLYSIAAGAAVAAPALTATAVGAQTAAAGMTVAAGAATALSVAVKRLLAATGIGLLLVAIGEIGLKLLGTGEAAKSTEKDLETVFEPPPTNGIADAAKTTTAALEGLKTQAGLAGAELRKTFDDVASSGKSVDQALSEIGKDFDLASVPGIQNAAVVLDGLLSEGKITAEQFQAAWDASLKNVNLADFELRARAALDGTWQGVGRLRDVLDGALREAIRRSGADFDVLSGGMSKAARSAINDTDTIINGLDRLRAKGVDVGAALEASLNKAIKTADGQAAIEALRSRVEQLRAVLGDKVADGLLAQIEDQAKKATGALSGLDGALQKLGITSDASLKKAAADTRSLYEEVVRTGGSAREQAQAFEKMASAAIASGDSASLAFVRSQAAAQGFEVAVDDAGKTIVRAMGSGKDAIDTMSDGITQATQNLKVYTDWLDKLEKRNAQVKSALLTDKDGFAVDSEGKRITQAVDNRASAASKLQAMGVDEARAKQLAATVFDERGNYTPKSSGFFRSSNDTADAVLQRMADAEKTRAPAVGTPATSTSHTVRIQLNNAAPTTINTASAQDASALSAVLASLQDAASRAR